MGFLWCILITGIKLILYYNTIVGPYLLQKVNMVLPGIENDPGDQQEIYDCQPVLLWPSEVVQEQTPLQQNEDNTLVRPAVTDGSKAWARGT